MFLNFNFRKILIAAGIVVAAIGIGFGIYITFFAAPKAAPPIVEAPPAGPAGAGLPAAGLGAPGPPAAGEAPSPGLPVAKTIKTANLTFTEAKNITVSGDGMSAQYYDSETGLFYKINPDGSLSPLSKKTFFQVEKATWSADADKAVLEYPDGSNIVYDFGTGVQKTLPKHWTDFKFTEGGEKIVAKSLGSDPASQWLVITDASGANTKIISSLGENADLIDIAPSPDGQIVGFSKTGDPTTGAGYQEVYLIGANNENLRSLRVSGLNFQGAWSKEGDRILYNVSDVTSDLKPALYAVDGTGNNVGKNPIKINLNTWVDKCAIISGYKAYCAVPSNLDVGAGLNPAVALQSDDSFYFVDLKTGATSFIGAPDTSYSVSQISVSSDENYIYFTDRATGALHQMKIK